jgi:hypothetical protein
MEVTECGIHGFAETIGIDIDELRFFWKLYFAAEDAKQVAYQVVVSTESNNTCWDSGRVESAEQRNIICIPDGGFQSTTAYYWIVTVWNQDGEKANSQINQFYTSYPRSSRLLPPYSMNQTYVRLCGQLGGIHIPRTNANECCLLLLV